MKYHSRTYESLDFSLFECFSNIRASLTLLRRKPDQVFGYILSTIMLKMSNRQNLVGKE